LHVTRYGIPAADETRSIPYAQYGAVAPAPEAPASGHALRHAAAPKLADVRELMRHLPEDRRARSIWRCVEQQLAGAAGADPADVAGALRMALMLENVECRPQ
jgi:hypothetical protein